MRMGPHVNTPHRANVAADFVRETQPDAVKVLDSGMDGRVIAAAREVGAQIIGRVYWDRQQLGAEYGRFIGRVVAFAHQHPEIGLLEGANEDFQGGQDLARYAEHEIERMKALEAIGRRAVIGNFSCGQPQYSEWPRFRPALEYAAAHGHVLGLHEYSGPVMQWMAGDNQVVRSGFAFGAVLDEFQAADDLLAWHRANYRRRRPLMARALFGFTSSAPALDDYRLNDACERPGVRGHLTLRYRYVLDLARQWGIPQLQVAITESGIDDVQPRPGPQGKGWRSYLGTPYAALAPFGDYAQQLGWYGRRLTEDANVVAWVDFGFSQAGDWQTFDLSEDDVMRGRVAAEMHRLPRGHAAASPPTPAPVPPVAVAQGPFAAIEVRKGQGKLAVARAAYGLPKTAPAAQVKAAVARIEEANPGLAWATGARLRVPGYRLVKEG